MDTRRGAKTPKLEKRVPAISNAATQPRRLRLVNSKELVDKPVLTLGQVLHLYRRLQEEEIAIGKNLAELRREILEVLRQMNVDHLVTADLEVVRRSPEGKPHLNAERTVSLLQRFHRLDEALVPVLDEERARRITEDLLHNGLINEGDLPYEEPVEPEALIVRST